MPSLGDIATWVGSIATLAALGFGLYQWRKSGQVHLSFKSFRVVSGLMDVTWMNTKIEIYNVGKDTTTIRRVRIEDREKSPVIVWANVDSDDQQLPYELAPGKFWTGYADTDITELIVSSISQSVKISVDYAHSDKPYLEQFKPERNY